MLALPICQGGLGENPKLECCSGQVVGNCFVSAAEANTKAKGGGPYVYCIESMEGKQ